MVVEREIFTMQNNGPTDNADSATQVPANIAAPSSSAASTATNEISNTEMLGQPLTAMNLAYEELRRTVHEATAARSNPSNHPRLLRSHVTALQEDTALLASFDTDDGVHRTQATQLILEARRLKRHLERDLIALEDREDANEQQLVQLVPFDNKKSSQMKLAPLRPPVFTGDAAQFRVFRDFFEENVLHNDHLTDTAKWLRLADGLTGQPAELISEIPKTSHTLKVAWKLLLDTYGGDDRPIIEIYDRLQRLPPAQLVTPSLRMTHSKLEGLLLSLEHLGHDVSSNGYIKWVYMSKFPVDIAYQVQKKQTATLAELRLEINELLLARECVDQAAGTPLPGSAPQPSSQRPPRPTNFEKRDMPSTSTKPANTRPLRCIFCNGEHWNDVCTVYPSLESRRERLTGKCFICLRRQHTGTPCTTQRRCFHCDSFEHNRALCPSKFQEPIATPIVQAAIVDEGISSQPTGHFLTFIAQASSPHIENPIDLRVVVDTAGGSTIIRRQAAQRLRIPIGQRKTKYTGLGDAELCSSYALHGPIQLHPPNGPSLLIQAEMVEWIIPDVPTVDLQQFRRSHPQYHATHIPPTGHGRPVDLLLGSNTMVDLIQPERIISVDNNTLLLPTRFGSLVLGRQWGPYEQVCHSLLFNSLSHPLNQMCNLDLVGFAGLHSTNIEDEQRAIQHFYDTVQFIDGRYSISWPWRSQPPQLDSNIGLALGRLRSLHKKLRHNPQLLHDYHAIIQKQLHDGIIEEVDFAANTRNLIHYLPHHPVLQPGKSTSLRPVYDGSSKTTPIQKSLNDNILKGKNWLNDLVQTLIRFRKFRTVVTADIAKAFHQISINVPDRDVTRFIWLKNPLEPPDNDNLQIYRFTRVAFGIVASPFILSATIQHHANTQPPNAFTPIITNNLYADNLVAALRDDIDPPRFYDYAKEFFASMKMDLTKWTTNNSTLTHHIPSADQLTDPTQPVLGLVWDKLLDTLQLKKPKQYHSETLTRRKVAQIMAAHFDPLGYATPILLLAKNFFRKIWSQTSNWDEQLSQADTQEWSDIEQILRTIEQIKLPRYLGLTDCSQQIQLHAFVDASSIAYAVVVYIRIQNVTESISKLVAAKSRLTPVKQTTIPKLELLAILLGCRFITFVHHALQLDQPTQLFVWSDSQCALSWVKQNKILPTIIERYINEARSYPITEFRYVPSTQNYADVATRGAPIQTLQQLDWWSGPTWLRDEAHWPTNHAQEKPENNISLIFQQKVMTKITPINENEIEGIATLNIKDFSSLDRLLTRTAYILRATTKLCKANFLHLTSDVDTLAAQKHWLRWDQQRTYALPHEPDAGKTFLLRGISVFRDTDGLIRCSTRIINSTLDIDTISPILLVPNSTFTKLLILQTHHLHHHAGTNHTLANIRKKFWLPQGRRQVFKVILNECYKCRRQIAQTYPNPPPAPLPEFRVTRSQKPFAAVGVDVFGPFTVRQAETTGYVVRKRWVILFTCATVRALHLETIAEMTTEIISHAFRRFIARRGVPQYFISDNAPQFHALDGYFSNLWQTLAQSPSISKYFAQHHIQWKFITQLAPWMGGLYERLIQSVKIAFEKTYGMKTLTSNQFDTAIIEIEAMLNARPLGYVDRDPETPIITPNDFLMATYVAIPINENAGTEDTITKLWKSSQAYLNEFWKHWADQYLLLLRERNDQLPERRRTARYEPQKGDIVVMQDLSKKRSAWQMAIVERLIPGADNVVRSVQIKIPNGSRLIRSVTALAPLKIKVDLPKIHDKQLNKRRDALILWPGEDASQEDVIPNENEDEMQAEEREDRQ